MILMENTEQHKIEYLLPEEIEKRSFEIISEELVQRGIQIPAEEEFITKRVIHTSADFDYVQTLCFSNGAVTIMKDLIRKGADIVTDTNMALSGINKRALSKFGGMAHCFMADEEVALLAKQRNMTRAAVSMEKRQPLKSRLFLQSVMRPRRLSNCMNYSGKRVISLLLSLVPRWDLSTWRRRKN